MELFIDTANIEEIKEAATWGIIDGVTTNPTLMSREGRPTEDIIREICSIINGPISAEVISEVAPGMVEEAVTLSQIHPNVIIKLPMTEEGTKACLELFLRKIKTNLTLVFSPNQALMAAKAHATYLSPFVGRLDDIGHDGMSLIEEIRTIYDNYGFMTKIIAASIRTPMHVRQAALIGCDVATVPYKVLKNLFKHTLTDKGVRAFLDDYKKIA